MSFKRVNSLLNIHYLNTIIPSKMRKSINKEINKDCKYISFDNVKSIFKNEINQIDLYGNNSNPKNLEHIYPQSFIKKHPLFKVMRSDMHNIYPCDNGMNSLRSNYKYISIEDYSKKNKNFKKIVNHNKEIINSIDEIILNQSNVMIIDSKLKLVIPNENARGKIARSLGYFAIKYNLLDNLNNVIDLDTLIEWNINEPVTSPEYLKNILVYKYQNNINPFILDPNLLVYSLSDYVNTEQYLIEKNTSDNMCDEYIITNLFKK